MKKKKGICFPLYQKKKKVNTLITIKVVDAYDFSTLFQLKNKNPETAISELIRFIDKKK